MSYKLRPCDCIDQEQAMRLEEQGISQNEDSFYIKPNYCVIKRGHTELKVPMSLFKKWAEWYLTEQEIQP